MLYKTSKKDFALEVIRDDKQERVIGYKEIDSDTLTYRIEDGKVIWHQYIQNPYTHRYFTDNQIIYVETNVKNEENT